MSGMHLTEREALYNTRRKYYPDGNGGYVLAECMRFEKRVFNPMGVVPLERYKRAAAEKNDFEQLVEIYLRELGYRYTNCVLPEDLAAARRSAKLFCELLQIEKERNAELKAASLQERSADNIKRSKRRAITKVYDYFNSNTDLNYFLTLTLSPDKVQRDNYAEIYRQLSNWLENRVRRNGLKYILIPEYHADGENIHFHGCANGEALKLINSGHKIGGKVAYNIADFDLGFTTAVRITGDNATVRVARYMLKYITKSFDSGEKIGGRYYLHGGKLALPRYEYSNEVIDMTEGNIYEVARGVAVQIEKFI